MSFKVVFCFCWLVGLLYFVLFFLISAKATFAGELLK